jgi:endonuclease-3 related protein
MRTITVKQLYNKLISHYWPRSWWPADTPFEVIVGAILTQNTSWSNVEKAITNMKNADLLEPMAIQKVHIRTLEKAVYPSGFFKQKARRLKDFNKYLIDNYNGDLDKMFAKPVDELRIELLEQKGIGPETADSILLYAGNRPIFVIDAYTRRLISRLGLTESLSYDELQEFFLENLPEDVQLYNEYHALIVEFAKNICKPKPQCDKCIISDYCKYYFEFLELNI